ncbi:PREDICTED: olfactory receptor 6C74-like [Nanorana parkeri]|uniref:olfactory receptor 6C74-like n=1 Tax=Nanorana parkeri TaxID=125878 RepID=UPI000854544E|nr:PREDICTED: olfactory receptor 6C74-like [Nanorana parkeri]
MIGNETTIKYFIIKGISDAPNLQFPIFFLVLVIYLITLTGNLTILVACRHPLLHTPMYFFLGNLSALDISCSTITLHRLLINFITGDKTVPFHQCMIQMYMFGSFGCLELFILTSMSYDRYVAICKPLHYHQIMNRRMCILLASLSWTLGFCEILPPFLIIYSYTCYSSNEINHFFCDVIPVMKISCNDTTILELLFFIEGLFPMIFTPFVLTFLPYIFIINAILKISTSTGRRKAFYTCSSHLTAVTLLYATLAIQYLTPNQSSTLEAKKILSLFNTAVIPMLNPFIYSLKNKDVKRALKLSLG